MNFPTTSFQRANKSFCQGEVWLLKTQYAEGEKEKPVIIASDKGFNTSNECVYIVPMTYEPKNMDDTMFLTYSAGRESTALCGNVKKVEKNRISKFIGKLTNQELISMKDCFSALFNIDVMKDSQQKEDSRIKSLPFDKRHFDEDDIKALVESMESITKERDFYKQQYDILLTKIVDRK